MAVGQVLIGRKEIPLTVPRPPLLDLQADAYAHSDANADQSGEDEEPRARHADRAPCARFRPPQLVIPMPTAYCHQLSYNCTTMS